MSVGETAAGQPAARPLGAFLTDAPLAPLGRFDAPAALAHATDIAVVLHPDGVVHDVALSAPALAELQVGGWLGATFKETVAPETRVKVEALLAGADTVGRRWRQVNHTLPDGTDVPVEYGLAHVGRSGARLLAGRELSSLAGLQQRLITAQQTMEREYARIRSAEARYRMLFQLTDVAVLVVDAQTERIVEANPAAARFFGMRAAQLPSAPLARVVPMADAGRLTAAIAAARATGTTQSLALQPTEGRNATLCLSLFTQAGKSFLLVRASAATHADSAAPSVGAVVERLPEGFCVCDERGTVLAANAAFVDLTQEAGIERVRGQSISQWLGRTSVDATLLFGALREGEAVRTFPSVMRGERGGLEDVEVVGVAVPAPDGGDCFGLSLRTVRPQVVTASIGLERSVQQLTHLVGRVPLKDLVRDATDLIERLCIEAALQLTDNNRASAAEKLGLSRQSLYNKMRRYDLTPGETSAEFDT